MTTNDKSHSMRDYELEQLLVEIFQSHFDLRGQLDIEVPPVKRVETFEQAQVLSSARGVVITFDSGEVFQVRVERVR